jgi:hypothetical protein
LPLMNVGIPRFPRLRTALKMNLKNKGKKK